VITGDVWAFGGKGSSGATLDREEHMVGFWGFVIFYFGFGMLVLWGVKKNLTEGEVTQNKGHEDEPE